MSHLRAVLAAGAFCLAWAFSARPAHADVVRSTLPGIRLQVDAGWGGWYRGGAAWVPVRISLTNSSASPVAGRLEIFDTALSDELQTGRTLTVQYSQSVSIAAETQQHLVLHLPGSDMANGVQVRLRVAGQVAAQSSVFPSPVPASDILLGVVTDDSASTSWTSGLLVRGHRVRVALVSPSSLDRFPEALANLDAIVLSNLDSSQMDGDQRAALERYVLNGGGLLEIGGPLAQQTLNALPSALVPGEFAGTRTVSDLGALEPPGAPRPPRDPTTAGVVRPAPGSVVAWSGSVPVLAQMPYGQGSVVYLAVDPSLAPMARWPQRNSVLAGFVARAAVQATRRFALPPGYDSASFLQPPAGDVAVDQALGAVAAPALRVAAFAVGVALGTIALLGWLPVLLFRRWRRSTRVWVTVPLASLAITAGVLHLEPQVRSLHVNVEAVGAVSMNGQGPLYPEHLYVGLTAPDAGDYTLAYGGQALAAPAVTLASLGQQSPGDGPVNWDISSAAATTVRFAGMRRGRTRTASLRAVTHIAGTVQMALHLDGAGNIVGYVHDATLLSLVRPALIAGRSWVALPNLKPGMTIPVRLRPAARVSDRDSGPVLQQVYGGAGREDSLGHAIKRALSMLPEANVDDMLGEVRLVAWVAQPLAPLTVPGQSADVQSLVLLERPGHVVIGSGPFHILPGTLGASLLDVSGGRPRYYCCEPTAQAIYLGAGGHATFAFALPPGTRSRVRALALSFYGGGQDTSVTGYAGVPPRSVAVYDWSAGRWIWPPFAGDTASLPAPGRLLSPTGTLLVRLSVWTDDHDLVVADPMQNLQLSARGV